MTSEKFNCSREFTCKFGCDKELICSLLLDDPEDREFCVVEFKEDLLRLLFLLILFLPVERLLAPEVVYL